MRQTRKCLYCNRQVKDYVYKGRFKGYGKTCDIHHGYEYRKGKFNPSWKGGKQKRQGYIYILDESKSHKNGLSRYTGEHTLVAQEKYKRKVEKDELVHHLNGIRDDNRSENLVIIKRKGHETWTYVKSLQQRIRDLEVLLNAKDKNKG